MERLPSSASLFVVDEIGKMECYSDAFVRRIRELLEGDAVLVATVARRGGGFAGRVRECPATPVVEVTRENRDELPDRILKWIAGRTGSSSGLRTE